MFYECSANVVLIDSMVEWMEIYNTEERQMQERARQAEVDNGNSQLDTYALLKKNMTAKPK